MHYPAMCQSSTCCLGAWPLRSAHKVLNQRALESGDGRAQPHLHAHLRRRCLPHPRRDGMVPAYSCYGNSAPPECSYQRTVRKLGVTAQRPGAPRPATTQATEPLGLLAKPERTTSHRYVRRAASHTGRCGGDASTPVQRSGAHRRYRSSEHRNDRPTRRPPPPPPRSRPLAADHGRRKRRQRRRASTTTSKPPPPPAAATTTTTTTRVGRIGTPLRARSSKQSKASQQSRGAARPLIARRLAA
eukprot:scaffold1363_cov356-Prasinococcus_capsulatus_cf.AAC.1